MLPAVAVDGCQLLPSSIKQGISCKQMRMPPSVALEDVELIRCTIFVVSAKWPRPGVLCCIRGRGVEGTLRDSEVEVAEDQLDSG